MTENHETLDHKQLGVSKEEMVRGLGDRRTKEKSNYYG